MTTAWRKDTKIHQRFIFGNIGRRSGQITYTLCGHCCFQQNLINILCIELKPKFNNNNTYVYAMSMYACMYVYNNNKNKQTVIYYDLTIRNQFASRI